MRNEVSRFRLRGAFQGDFETDGLTTKKVETNPLTWKTTTEYVRSWGAPSAQTDMNGKRTDLAYDALGRMTSVWLPDRPKAEFTPSVKYSYLVRKTAPVAVRTQKIEKDGVSYGSEYALYDGLMRPRQQQTEASGGGRMVADTFYDGVGRIVKANADYYTTGEPGDTVFKAVNGDTDAQSRTEYDGAGRKTADIFQVAGEEKWRTTYVHEADRVHVDPPAGTPPTTTIADAHGRTVEVRRYKGDKPELTATTGFESMRYTYTPAGQTDTITDQAGNVWSYGYDQLGRKSWSEDPDTGRTVYAYDTMDRLLSTTDSRNKKISTKYDKLGRVLSTWEGEPDTGTKLTVSTYDTLAKGRSSASYRYENGVVQSSSVVAEIDDMYQPTVSRVTLAGSEAAELKGTYEFGTQYNKDGTVQSVRMPAVGGLPAETLTTTYDDLQRPVSLTSSLGSSYVNAARYAPTSQLQQLELSSGGTAKKTWLTYAYERGTNRLTNTRVDYEGAASVAADTSYTYDPAGNIMSIADTPTGNTADVQCFDYDWQRRLSSAWTTTNASNDALGTGAKDAACASAPTSSTIGGAAPYWQTFAYDLAGNRTQQVLKGFDGKPDSTRTYNYGEGADGPHQLSTVTQMTPAFGTTPALTRQDSFDYTEAGHTDVRVRDGSTQDLQWSATGQLTKAVEAGKTSSFVYDAGGSRLVRKEPGAETLYLPGMELKLNTATRAVEATRYYGFGGQTVAIRTPKGVQYLSGDHHGTMALAIDAASGSVTRRRMDPFGTTREPVGKPWVDDKGFLGKPVDASTGLTHIGARQYEPENGRFISADPLIDFSDPQQINGYAYANNNPVTFSDPTGLMIYDEVTGLGFGNAQVLQNYIDRDPVRYSLMAQRDTTAVRKYNEAAAKAAAAKARAIATAKELGSIIADELGITDALDCFTTGSLGACGATIVNVVTSAVGGAIGKLAAKYGLPWNWEKGIALGKRVSGLVEGLFSSFNAWMKWDDKAAALKGAADKGRAALSALNAKIRGLPTACPINNSFTPDTKVLMADGKAKAIKDVRVGDKVLAKDPKTGVTKAKLVTAEIKGKGAKKLVDVVIDVDGKKGTKTASVTATDGHPFWVPELDAWIDATDLKSGQWLDSGAGTKVQIAAVKRWTQPATVHNLTVADIHTYYVLAGAVPVLVHNCKTLTHQEAADKANQALSDKLDEMHGDPNISRTAIRKYAMGSAAVDRRSGEVAVNLKKSGDGDFCAEDMCRAELVAGGANPEDIVYSVPIRPLKQEPAPVCVRCEGRTTRDQFAPGTTWESDLG
ncbi:polymorphic toxin-type HINT domain-containing protein [Streptomyces sp. NPDC060194]|uniref:polymorphic toxin-type HINT domain-containing protein n=1 Tax=Streptomyces sp. NPDC060194 TaxID=3347069 RepID=UPI003659908B